MCVAMSSVSAVVIMCGVRRHTVLNFYCMYSCQFRISPRGLNKVNIILSYLILPSYRIIGALSPIAEIRL